MRKLTINGAMLASLLWLSACGGGSVETKSESTKLSYDFSEDDNGDKCNTKQFFSSLEAYCAGLKDEPLNHFCAVDARKAAFKQDCAGSFSAKIENPQTAEGGALLRQPKQSVAEIREDRKTIPVQQPLSVPESVAIVGYPVSPLRVSPTGTGDSITSTLEGKIQISSSSPQLDKQPRLGLAREVVFKKPVLENCKLTFQNFASSTPDGIIGFTLVGLDNATGLDAKGCLSVLSTMGMGGFEVEFKEVPASALGDERIPLITLRVVPNSYKE